MIALIVFLGHVLLKFKIYPTKMLAVIVSLSMFFLKISAEDKIGVIVRCVEHNAMTVLKV